MRLAADRLLDSARSDSAILAGICRYRDLQFASDRLEGTYTIRLFAEFEIGLRAYWRALGRITSPQAKDMIDGVASRQRVPEAHSADVHRVREWRNTLIHEREEPTDEVPLATAKRHLSRFFSFLPPNW